MITNIMRVQRAAWLATFVGFASVGLSQETRLPPNEVGQILNVALQALVPSEHSVSRVPVAMRGTFLDFERTMTAFGYTAPWSIPFASLGLLSAKQGSRALLDDCDRMRMKTCSQLGWSLYVWAQPVSITASHGRVRAFIFWPDRGPTPLSPNSRPEGAAVLVGFSAEVEVQRAADGRWQYLSKGSYSVF
jgi:hypothetical protein